MKMNQLHPTLAVTILLLELVACIGGHSNVPPPGSMAGAWDFTATGGSGNHPIAVEAILTQDNSGNFSGAGTVTANGPAGNFFEADIFGSSLSTATDMAVDFLGDTCSGSDSGNRSLSGTINSSNQVTLTVSSGGSLTVTVNGTLDASATPPFSGSGTISAPGCKSDGQTFTLTGSLASSLTASYSGTSASDNTDTISVTLTDTNATLSGNGTDTKNGNFTVTGTAVGNAFSATLVFSGGNSSTFGYFDPQLGSKGSILLVSFEGGSATTCSNGVPIDNGSCLIAILAKQ